MTQQVGELNPPYRLMLTPGPSSVDPRVYRALATPLVGHLDPWFKTCMDETQILLRQIISNGEPVDDAAVGVGLGVGLKPRC